MRPQEREVMEGKTLGEGGNGWEYLGEREVVGG